MTTKTKHHKVKKLVQKHNEALLQVALSQERAQTREIATVGLNSRNQNHARNLPKNKTLCRKRRFRELGDGTTFDTSFDGRFESYETASTSLGLNLSSISNVSQFQMIIHQWLINLILHLK